MALTKVREEGFTVLCDSVDPIVDLVFVHGLQGHPAKKWTYGHRGTENKSRGLKKGAVKLFSRKKGSKDAGDPVTSEAPDVFWPRDLLAKDYGNIRVLTYGYDSHVSRFFKGPANQSGILAHGTALMRALEVERRKCRKRPIIFLTHSLGGIVLKQALIRSKNALPEDQGFLDIYESTYAIVFFGTPHRGSQYAELAVVARDIAVAAGFDARDTLLRSLKSDAEILSVLSEDFSRMLHERAFKIHSFQEGQGLTGAHFLSRKIVESYSSCLGDAREGTDFINGNHMMMCRFRDEDDEGYRKVKGVVSQYLDEIQVSRAHRIEAHQLHGVTDNRNRADERQLLVASRTEADVNTPAPEVGLERLGLVKRICNSLRTAHMNERVGEVERAHDHTFDWIFTHPDAEFLKWLRGDGGLFWITGKPGSGKSTLMKYILNDERTRDALSESGRNLLSMPVFFFHSRGVKTEKSFKGLLRSIIHQLISDVPELVDCVAGIYHEYDEQGQDCPWNLRQLETALNNLRRIDMEGFICLFIDALDEYSGRREDIARFIKRLVLPMGNADKGKLRIRVCASSRPETTFISLLKDIPSITIQDWTKGDIEKYAEDRLNDCDRTDTSVILREITNRADGVFLWAKLVLDEVWQPLCDGKSIDEGLSLVSKLPTDLPNFYKRMVKQIVLEDRPVFFAMFELALSSDYLMGLDKLEAFCLVIDLLGKEDTVTAKDVSLAPADDARRLHDVGRRIRACSGGLLEISVSRVQFVHQTVKSFIQDEKNSDLFDGKSTRDMALAGLERRMLLVNLLVGKMDSTSSWNGIFHVASHRAEFKKMDNFDYEVLVAFATFAMAAECSFQSKNSDLAHALEAAMRSYCGKDWLDTWWSSVVTPRSIFGGVWVKGSLQPKSFIEFALQFELIGFVQSELEKEIAANPGCPRNSRLWHYTLAGNATSHWDRNHFLYHSPESWLGFARFLLSNGFDPNAMLEVDIAPDRGKLMCGGNHSRSSVKNFSVLEGAPEEDGNENSDTTESSDKSILVAESSENYNSQASENVKQTEKNFKATVVDEKETEDDSKSIQSHSDYSQHSVICCVSVMHLTLAMACTDGSVEQSICRFNMLSLLVEASGEATTSSYRNYWSLSEESGIEQSAIHYLLSFNYYYEDEDMIEARDKCIAAFLNSGADPNAVNRTGASILEISLDSCSYSLIELMLNKGAKVTEGLLLDSGVPRLDAGGILNEMRWRKPEMYTPQARQVAIKYNTHWPALDEREDLEVLRASSPNNNDILGTVSGFIGNLTDSVKIWASSSRRR